VAYKSFNAFSYGPHFWMWEVYMDCSATENGWFELKGYLDGQWESDVNQSVCGGLTGGTAPSSRNHVARYVIDS